MSDVENNENVTQKRLGELVAFPMPKDKGYLAFHAKNMEVAEIDKEAWEALSQPNGSAGAELHEWSGSIAKEANDQKPHISSSSLQLNISQICNLKCTYCGAGGDGTYGSDQYKVDLTAAYRQISHMLNNLKSGENFRLNFIGGEPLLYPKEIERIADYTKLATAGKNIEVFYDTTTNGTLITSEVAQLLAKLNMAVTVSLDGPAEINDLHRPAKRKDLSSTEMTEKGLEQLQKVRSQLRRLSFNCVFGKHNTDLVKSYLYLKQWNPDSIVFNFAAEADSTLEEEQKANEKYLQELNEVTRLAFKAGGRKDVLKILPIANMLRHLESQTRKINHCGAGKSMLHMESSGDLYACNWFIERGDEQLGKAGQVDESKLSKYSDSLIDLHDCNSCWARHLCGGGCMLFNYEKNGDKHVSDPEFCFRTRETAKIAIEYFYKLNSENQETQ